MKLYSFGRNNIITVQRDGFDRNPKSGVVGKQFIFYLACMVYAVWWRVKRVTLSIHAGSDNTSDFCVLKRTRCICGSILMSKKLASHLFLPALGSKNPKIYFYFFGVYELKWWCAFSRTREFTRVIASHGTGERWCNFSTTNLMC